MTTAAYISSVLHGPSRGAMWSCSKFSFCTECVAREAQFLSKNVGGEASFIRPSNSLLARSPSRRLRYKRINSPSQFYSPSGRSDCLLSKEGRIMRTGKADCCDLRKVPLQRNKQSSRCQEVGFFFRSSAALRRADSSSQGGTKLPASLPNKESPLRMRWKRSRSDAHSRSMSDEGRLQGRKLMLSLSVPMPIADAPSFFCGHYCSDSVSCDLRLVSPNANSVALRRGFRQSGRHSNRNEDSSSKVQTSTATAVLPSEDFSASEDTYGGNDWCDCATRLARLPVHHFSQSVEGFVHVSHILQETKCHRVLTGIRRDDRHLSEVEAAISNYVKKSIERRQSLIHGIGVFARQPLQAQQLVMEYGGELVGKASIDKRERRYLREGIKDCYLFKLPNGDVIDATRSKSLARRINHSCNPNMHSRINYVEREYRIVFCTLRKVKRGEELTIDYQFEEEAEEKKLPCTCGAKTCRKFLNYSG